MKHLKPYKLFEQKTGYLVKYNEKDLEKTLGEKPSPGMLSWLNGFFTKMSNRFDKYENNYNSGNFGSTPISKTASGTPLDFGFGFLVGKAGSLASHIGKKLTEPSKPSSLSDNDLQAKRKLVHQGLFDNKGIPNDLHKIKTEESLLDKVSSIYKNNGVSPGQDSYIDNQALNYSASVGKNLNLAKTAESTMGAEEMLIVAGG